MKRGETLVAVLTVVAIILALGCIAVRMAAIVPTVPRYR